ncbi:MAG: SDR family oxidoreductase [Bacteroidales bacterium]|nr:SDR family oxidoreductase [Bacteroidales bacterium]
MKIFLTGATGLLGGELIVNLSKRNDISEIYCLVRGCSQIEAQFRIQKVFDLYGDFYDRKKIKIILANLNDENLTSLLTKNSDLQNIDTVIHAAANTSFSKFHDQVVEKTNIGGLTSILNWAKTLINLKLFTYISTATVCGKDTTDRIVFENESPNIYASHLVKYTYTKMQGEMLVRKELDAKKILILRPSIIMGNSKGIIPRSPVILWALATINALRLCMFRPHTKVDIIPVDYVAEVIEKIVFSQNRKHSVYHISAGPMNSTTPMKILSAIEPHFKDLPSFQFVSKELMQQLKLWSKGRLTDEAEIVYFKNYLEMWVQTFERKENMRKIFIGIEPYIDFIDLGHTFDNSRILQEFQLKNSTPAHEYIVHSVEFLKNIDVLEGTFTKQL